MLRAGLFVLALAVLLLLPGDAYGEQGRAARCHEDQACWHWPTMGNQRRGIVTSWGDYRVVDACTFRAYWRRGLINPRTGHYPMRGDHYARTRGCN